MFQFDIGLRHAYEITTGNMANLLPKKEEMTTKMLFKFSDIVAMSALMSEEKVIRGECIVCCSVLFRFSLFSFDITALWESLPFSWSVPVLGGMCTAPRGNALWC